MTSNDAKIDAQLREVIKAWSSILDLPAFAIQKRGYGDSDGGFGITYPSDLDEYQKEVERVIIPEGMIEAYGYWGPPEVMNFWSPK